MSTQVDRVEKYGCKIVTVEPAQRRVEGVIKSGAVVQVAIYTVDPFFRWPKVGENWMIRRENGTWVLDSKWQEQESVEPGSPLTIINNLDEGDALIDTPTGNIYLPSGQTLIKTGQMGTVRERGRVRLSSGRATVSAPGVRDENTILLTGEGIVTHGIVVVKEREVESGFVVESTVTSSNEDYVNWAILW